jgi:hypothetical protein
MATVSTCVAALAVATIYYIWRSYAHELFFKQRQLRDRVTYMLWVAANGEE